MWILEIAMTASVADRLELDWRGKLFLSEKYSDCSILVKTCDCNTRFPGHRAVLASSSEMFAEILESLSEEKEKVIVMEDVNPHAVAKVLEYVYLGNAKFSDWKFVSDMTRIACKYKIKNLIQKCSDNLRKQITLQNVCSILEIAILGDLEELVKECKSVCREGGFVVLDTIAFQDSNPVIVKTILSIPDLQVPSEMSVFKAAWNWSTYKCCKEEKHISDENVADEMSSLFECIGFEFMSEEEVKSIPRAALKIFHQKLEVKSEDDETSTKPLTKGRNITFPMHLWKFCKIFEFDCEDDDGIHLAGNITLLRFIVNTRVYLKSISYGFTVAKKSRAQNATFHIHNKRGKVVSFSESVDVNSSTGNNPEEVSELFKASDLLVIEADEVHTIEVDVAANHKNFTWFLTSLKHKRLGDVEFTVLTENCYGIYQLGFIEAS